MKRTIAALVAVGLVCGCKKSESTATDGSSTASGGTVTLLNVSYDPTRELYNDVNRGFDAEWFKQKGVHVKVNMPHGGSGKQARAIIDGLEADVATLALAYDIDMLEKKGGLIAANWQSRLPERSSPYTSTIVFVVRKGNPKQIKDWGDLIKKDVQVITPNPKTSGGARWNYLGAWGYALRQPGGTETSAQEFVGKLYKNVPVLDSGARGATTTFAERGIGDVLIAWENEALLLEQEIGKGKFEIVPPSLSIRCEPPVTVVDKMADKHKTREVAEAYLRYLYTPAGQAIVAKHHFRPRDAAALAAEARKFPQIPMFTIDEVFGGWAAAHKKHFEDGGVFDQMYDSNN
jgi:sulfate transport system substrate-binding protein